MNAEQQKKPEEQEQEEHQISAEQQALLDAEAQNAAESHEELTEEQKEKLRAAVGELEDQIIDAGPNLEEEIAKLKDQLVRAVAETENIRKRSERDVQDSRKYAVTGFARDLVNVVENLQLALQNIPEEVRKQDEKLDNLAQGVEMTYNELIRVFSSHGISRIDPMGEKFNHNHHQAVSQIESPNAEPGTVIQVLQAGYIIHDRLLRPAMVVVAKGGGESVDTKA